MAATIFIQDGGSIDYIPIVDTAAGTVVVQNNLIGITKQAIKANKLGALAVEGIFDFPTEDVGVWSVGDFAYWSKGDEWAVTTPTEENMLIGKVVKVDPRPGLFYVRIRMTQ